MNELRKRKVKTVFKGEKFYPLQDPEDGSTFPHYVISKSGSVMTNMCSKDKSVYKKMFIYARPNTSSRSYAILRKDGRMIKRYISELVAFNFLTNPSDIEPDEYVINDRSYTRDYSDSSSWYIIFKDGNVNNTNLSNLEYARFIDYMDHCRKMNMKCFINYKEKEMMIDMFINNGYCGGSMISRKLHLTSPAILSGIYRTYMQNNGIFK